jgi:hypothetical protein
LPLAPYLPCYAMLTLVCLNMVPNFCMFVIRVAFSMSKWFLGYCVIFGLEMVWLFLRAQYQSLLTVQMIRVGQFTVVDSIC